MNFKINAEIKLWDQRPEKYRSIRTAYNLGLDPICSEGRCGENTGSPFATYRLKLLCLTFLTLGFIVWYSLFIAL